MFDEKLISIICVIVNYLYNIQFNTKIISYANIENYPDKLKNGFCFSPVSKNEQTEIKYVILIYSTFEKNISVIKSTLNKLVSDNHPRKDAINDILSKDDDYLFIFSFLHEVGHINHIIELNIADDMFFNSLTGINSNPENNIFYERYADSFALEHIDSIYIALKQN